MILHTPEVKEQLEKFGIHVLVDYSSYEPEPLGSRKVLGKPAGEGESPVSERETD